MKKRKSQNKNTEFPVRNGFGLFGLHLMVDAYDANPEKLADMKLVFSFLNNLPEKIEMKKLTAPQVIDADATATGKDPGGISGVVIIAESHISIHTFPNKGFLTMDLYSCNNFEEFVPTVVEYIKETFEFEYKELQLVTRGGYYPME